MINLSKCEWFEILDPKTKKRVFINSFSGKCQWNPPDKFHELTDDQWWELYDFKSNHFYYFNCQTMAKTWVKPNTINCVPLVRLQMIKERNKKIFAEQSTQTKEEHKSARNDIHVDASLSKEVIIRNSQTNIDTVPINTFGLISANASNNDYYDLISTLQTTRKPVPRTNPNYDRRNSSTYRLSQPIIGIHDDMFFEDINHESTNHSDSLTNLYALQLGIPTNTTLDTFPSTSKTQITNSNGNGAINTFGLTMPMNTEIWNRKLFNKSGRELAGIMSWTAKSIQDPLLAETPKAYKKKACMNFKQIQMYMSDREPDTSNELLALHICRRGISSPLWANEIFMQLCKQVTHNPNKMKTFLGWELICICLMFFHPESLEMKKCFLSFIEQYACSNQHIDVNMVDISDFHSKSIFCARMSLKLLARCHKALEVTAQDVSNAKKNYAYSTIFFSSLDEVMDIQSHLYPNKKLPWIQVALTRETLRCNGAKTQGILRIPSEIGKIEALTEAIESAFKPNAIIDISLISSPNECDPLLNKILDDLHFDHDPLLLSSVLKYWLRHFRLPLVSFEDKSDSLSIIAKDYTKILKKLESLPAINYLVLRYMIYFLQVLSQPENVVHTNMPVENLVTLMAPTLFKLDLNELQPAMNLLQSLVLNLDTSDMGDII